MIPHPTPTWASSKVVIDEICWSPSASSTSAPPIRSSSITAVSKKSIPSKVESASFVWSLEATRENASKKKHDAYVAWTATRYYGTYSYV